MPYWRLYYHLVWGTKERQPLLVEAIESAVYEAIKRKGASLGGQVFEVGGTEDHIHVASSIPPSTAIGRFIGEIKGASSFQVNHLPGRESTLYWQEDYGVVSFRHENLQQVIEYIRRQKEHHLSGKLWPSLEIWEEPGKGQPGRVGEESGTYDPFAVAPPAPEGEPSG